MGTSILEAFFVTVGLDDSDYQSGSKRVGEANKRLKEDARKAFGDIEHGGKALGDALRGVRNETVGMFLAFSGASSITGFLSNIVTTTAAADRMGNTLGMATGKVVAWRHAMLGVGGSAGSADAALQGIERMVQSFRLTGSSGADADLMGLGIRRTDLMSKDPGDILKQLAKAGDRMPGPEFSARLQRIGMPQDMIYFLSQGSEKVGKLLEEFEKNSDQYEKQAKEAQKLQEAMAELNDSVTKMLVPALNKLVPQVTKLVDIINGWIGGGDSKPAAGGGGGWSWGIPGLFQLKSGGGGGGAQAAPKGVLPQDDHIIRYFVANGVPHHVAVGIRAGIEAEGGLQRPFGGGYKGRAIGIGQLLGPRRDAIIKKYGPRPNLDQQLEFMLWELRGGDPGGKSVLNSGNTSEAFQNMITKFYRPQGKNWEHMDAWRGDMRRGAKALQQYAGSLTIHKITINTRATDAAGIARDLHGALGRRAIVAHADAGMAA